jgi:hypothetical protein
MITPLRNSLWIFLIALTLNLSASADVVEVQKDQPAPYTGILFSPDKASETRAAIIQRDALRITLADQDKKLEETNSRSDLEKVAYFLLGAAVTGVSFYVVHSFTH